MKYMMKQESEAENSNLSCEQELYGDELSNNQKTIYTDTSS